MRKSRYLVLAVLALSALCLVMSLLGFLALRAGLRRDRPIVLIHLPRRQQQVALGQGVSVHATARAWSGVSRMELWADGERIAIEAPNDGPASPLVLAAAWEPATLGSHTLIVRAFSRWGVAGQSSVAVAAFAADSEAAAQAPVAGGEGAASGPQVADEGGGGEGAAPGDGGPPAAHASAPGSTQGLFDVFHFTPFFSVEAEAGRTIGLRLELLSLQTEIAYEGLHCYIGLGGEPPRWFPDQDGDPSTDESFAPLGGGAWDVASHLARPAGPVVPWPGNQTLPIDVACVGLSEGGTEASDLGRLALTLVPEVWDGAIHAAHVSGREGGFSLEYRVTPEGGAPGWAYTDLDFDMTPPTNLRIDDRRHVLRWDYSPQPDEEPIDGFRVYLNGTLQWTEPAEARSTGLPYEWLVPPCDQQYQFYVDAYRGGDWSFPSNILLVPESGPNEDCTRSVIVTFETLTTHDLGGDQDHVDWVGAVYGGFYANDERIGFDGRCGWNEVCGDIGLRDRREYGLSEFLDEMGSANTQLYVEVAEGEGLVVGFDIDDEDSWPNDDDSVCDASVQVDQALDRVVEGTIESDNGRCDLAFSARPGFGSLVEGLGDSPPRPMLIVEDLTVDQASGQLQIHVRNVGAGTWPEHDLQVTLVWPSGAAIGLYTFPDFFLAPGDRAVLQDPSMAPEPDPALSACVYLDPGNQIPEEEDDAPSLRRGRYCRPLPDLIITRANYDPDGERLELTVQNWGEGSLDELDVDVILRLADGVTTYEATWSDVAIEPDGEVVLQWPGLRGEQRERLLTGYTAIVDPHNRIAEQNDDNNELSVMIPEAVPLQLNWGRVYMPFYQVPGIGGDNVDNFTFRADVVERVTGRVLQSPANWSAGGRESCRVRRGQDYWGPGGRHGDCHAGSDVASFYLTPDTSLAILVVGSMEFYSDLGGGSLTSYDLGSGRLVIEPDAWATVPSCNSYEGGFFEIHVSPPENLIGASWYTSLRLCRLPE
jgi:hypothetical protein